MSTQNNHMDESDEQEPNVYENDEAYMLGEDNDDDNISNHSLEQLNNPNTELLHHNNNDDETEEEILNEQEFQTNSNNVYNKYHNNNDNNNIYHHPNENEQDEEEGTTIRNKDEDDNDNDTNNNENEEIENDEEANPLITLNYISICQCCKNPFNSYLHIPYLFKCGHFFCKQCIEDNFTDEEGIKCPNDGLIAKSISNLKLLNNLITDKDVDIQSQRGNLCEIHKGQKLTHYIEDTKELICVYCAFAKFKQNPKTEIKEIKEKNIEMISDLNTIIEDNQRNVEMIQSALKDIKKNKETEEKRVKLFYEQIINYYTNKKNEMLKQIDVLFTENAKKLSQKLELFSSKIEQSENLKKIIDVDNNNSNNNYMGNINSFSFLDTLEKYNKLIKGNTDRIKLNVLLNEYRFVHEDENKMMKMINNLGDLQIGSKNFMFNGGKEMNVDFGFKTMKINTNSHYNIPSQHSNDMLLNNSDIQGQLHNTTFDFRYGSNNNNNIQGSGNSQNGKGERKGYAGIANIANNSSMKNSMNKYSYNKPMTPGDYRTDYKNDYVSKYQRNYKG